MAKAAAPVRYRFQYAVKFVCTSNIPGTSQTSDAVLPGSYETSINVHNPLPKVVRWRRKLAFPGTISDFKDDTLKPDEAARITCARVAEEFGPFIHGVEGWVVIESTGSIDVSAVYTAAGDAKVSSFQVVDVRERKLA
ncbi:MAG: hypothetical protein ACKVT1_10950 [Dehalococcoidia bacterium]